MNIGKRFEDYVAELLSSLGFQILDKRVKVYLNGVEVGEVDLIAVDNNGQRYAIEVKSGKIDVTGVRQAYVNAILLNAKPMIIARGFSNDSAKILAENLGVKTIILDDVIVLRTDELKTVIKQAIYEILNELFEDLLKIPNIVDNDLVKVAINCNDWKCICDELGYSDIECGNFIRKIKEQLNSSSLSYLKFKVLIKIAQLVAKLFNS